MELDEFEHMSLLNAFKNIRELLEATKSDQNNKKLFCYVKLDINFMKSHRFVQMIISLLRYLKRIKKIRVS